MKTYTNHSNKDRSRRTDQTSPINHSHFLKRAQGDSNTRILSLYLALITLLIIPISCNRTDTTPCVDKNCSDYSTQAAAQADFELYPECRNDLDADNDSIACEQWFGEDEVPEDCPTTANCGCSNRRKAECESNCCRWVIGQGCRCS